MNCQEKFQIFKSRTIHTVPVTTVYILNNSSHLPIIGLDWVCARFDERLEAEVPAVGGGVVHARVAGRVGLVGVGAQRQEVGSHMGLTVHHRVNEGCPRQLV